MAARRKRQAEQPSLFDAAVSTDTANRTTITERSTTFLDNLSLPIHRWFRYSAGFSAEWVRDVITRERANGRTRILDPFAGSGTVLIEAEQAQVESFGAEAHPFVYRAANAKLHWRTDPKLFAACAQEVSEAAERVSAPARAFPPLLTKCFPADVLTRLESLRVACATIDDGTANAELIWLVLASILRECSPVGTAQWQYILPKKSKTRITDPFEAFRARVRLFARDMTLLQQCACGVRGRVINDDARSLSSIPDRWADLIITSPPYANNYDYADATRLEMTFFGEIEGWGCLQDRVRRHLVRSCTQHVSSLIGRTSQLIADPMLRPIERELGAVCERLAEERETHGGKKAYHTMIAAYFLDMAQVCAALRRASATGCRVCFVVGDSAPYGVHVPVERWLGELAVAAGFKQFHFEKTRDRNTKWKNRKHRVPLHEGRLWVEG